MSGPFGPVPFKYGDMYRFYKSFGKPTSDVFVQMYNADYCAMKYLRAVPPESAGERATFLQPTMQVRKVPPEDSLSTAHGAFMVSRQGLTDKCQRMYVVVPKMHDDAFGSRAFLTADHFTFQTNNGGGVPADKKLQLHRTMYLPSPDRPDAGYTVRVQSHLPKCLDIPADVQAFREYLTPDVAPFATYLHDLMCRPATGPAGPGAPTNPSGGARRCRTARAANFAEMWQVLPIHRLVVVGIRNGDGFDVTVFVFDRLNRGNVSRAVVFRTDAEKDMRATIANYFKNYCWDDFDMSGPSDDD